MSDSEYVRVRRHKKKYGKKTVRDNVASNKNVLGLVEKIIKHAEYTALNIFLVYIKLFYKEID